MMEMLKLENGGLARLTAVPEFSFDEFRLRLTDAVIHGERRVSAFFAVADMASAGGLRLYGVLLDPGSGKFELAQTTLAERTFAALSDICPPFHWFEREIAELWDAKILHHPWLKPIRFTGPSHGAPGAGDPFTVGGDAVHEVAVGPVHAGVIEPGHFRFQCLGETVLHLEISLGYQHRGLEKLLLGGPDMRTRHLLETAAGDSAVAGATAYSMIAEALGGMAPPTSAVMLERAILLELERMANHIGDLGALAGDAAFLPTASFAGRIRGEYLNLTAMISGNRFGRGTVIPGGVTRKITPALAARLTERLQTLYPELENAMTLMFNAPSVLDRFENTGSLTLAAARELGLVGVAARACGLTADVRRDLNGMLHPPAAVTEDGGDVFARALVRFRELAASHQWLLQALGELPDDGTAAVRPDTPPPAAAPASIAVAAVEAWRGELVHVALTDEHGCFRLYKVVDPSFHNWFGLAQALRNEQISNFPLCNKSFNLSYCGHDL